MTPTALLDPEFGFTNPDLLRGGLPLQRFSELRRSMPAWLSAQPSGTGGFRDGGSWAISMHERVASNSQGDATRSANRNGVVIRFHDGMTPERIGLTKALPIEHDVPVHSRPRNRVSRLFTRRSVATMAATLDEGPAES